ncbi:MAG TPA: hypothetical protein VMD76_10630 [Candidatus Sulfotelmatobacter sp.]|nr:hypothetical protein [Candidatus Sulfotelmatobacter sp.]
MADSFLSAAGWLFSVAWGVTMGAVTIAAFGRDLLRWKTYSVPVHSASPTHAHHGGNSLEASSNR